MANRPNPTQCGKGLVRLDPFAIALAEALSCRSRPLFVPCDESVAWSWLPLGSWCPGTSLIREDVVVMRRSVVVVTR